MELLSPLAANQQHCVEQVIGENNLIYVKEKAGSDVVYIGYNNRDDYYVSIIRSDDSGRCETEFQKRIWNCYEERANDACVEGYEFKPMDIQEAELTGNPPSEIYISFDTLGPGKRINAHHIFYVEEAGGDYEALLHLQLCLGLSSVEIDTDLQTIVATDDLVCDMFHGRKEHMEYSLLNGEVTVVANWFDE